MQFDPNYFTSLNPFAEPWRPSVGQMPAMGMSQNYMSQQSPQRHPSQKDHGGCKMCSQQQKEEEKRRQEQKDHDDLCDKHSKQTTGSSSKSESNSPQDNTSAKANTYSSESRETADKSSKENYKKGKCGHSSDNWPQERDGKEYEEAPAWSTVEDDEAGEITEEYDYEKSTQQFEQERTLFNQGTLEEDLESTSPMENSHSNSPTEVRSDIYFEDS